MKFTSKSDIIVNHLMSEFEQFAERNVVGLRVCMFSKEACERLRIKERVMEVMRKAGDDELLRSDCKKAIKHIKMLEEGQWKEGKKEKGMSRKRKHSGEESKAKKAKVMEVEPKKMVAGGKLEMMRKMMVKAESKVEAPKVEKCGGGKNFAMLKKLMQPKRSTTMVVTPMTPATGEKMEAMKKLREVVDMKKVVVSEKRGGKKIKMEEKKAAPKAPVTGKMALMMKHKALEDTVPKKPTGEKLAAMEKQRKVEAKRVEVGKKIPSKNIKMTDAAPNKPVGRGKGAMKMEQKDVEMIHQLDEEVDVENINLFDDLDDAAVELLNNNIDEEMKVMAQTSSF